MVLAASWFRGLNTSRAKVIRSQRDNARKRMEEEKVKAWVGRNSMVLFQLRKLENTRIEYENKVQQEESIRARTEALVSAMEKEEMELIQVG